MIEILKMRPITLEDFVSVTGPFHTDNLLFPHHATYDDVAVKLVKDLQDTARDSHQEISDAVLVFAQSLPVIEGSEGSGRTNAMRSTTPEPSTRFRGEPVKEVYKTRESHVYLRGEPMKEIYKTREKKAKDASYSQVTLDELAEQMRVDFTEEAPAVKVPTKDLEAMHNEFLENKIDKLSEEVRYITALENNIEKLREETKELERQLDAAKQLNAELSNCIWNMIPKIQVCSGNK